MRGSVGGFELESQWGHLRSAWAEAPHVFSLAKEVDPEDEPEDDVDFDDEDLDEDELGDELDDDELDIDEDDIDDEYDTADEEERGPTAPRRYDD